MSRVMLAMLVVGATIPLGLLTPVGEEGTSALIWLAVGLALGVVLLLPAEQRRVGFGMYALVGAIAFILSGRSPYEAMATITANVVMVAVAVAVVGRDREWIDGGRESVRAWATFGAGAVVLAPALGSVVGVVLLELVRTGGLTWAGFWPVCLVWWLANGVSVATATPVVLRLRPGYVRRAGQLLRRPAELAVLLVIVLGCSIGAMVQPHVALVFVTWVPLVVMLARLGFAGGTLGAAVVSSVVLATTRLGHGPFVAAEHYTDMGEALLWAQGFLLLMLSMVLTCGAFEAERRRLAEQYSTNEEVARLAGDHGGDAITVVGPGGTIVYASAAATVLHRLATGDRLQLRDWMRNVHAGDRHAVAALARSVGTGLTERASLTYQSRLGDGRWAWLETHVRAAAGVNGQAALFVLMTRDVTERTERQAELVRPEEAAVTSTDPATGLPGHRQFAELLATAWEDSTRSGHPLVLILVHVDGFSDYEDRHGRDAGDRCLVSIAAALGSILRRRFDVVARYRGAEFVMLLPGTDLRGGCVVADRVCRAVRELAIPRDGPAGPTVTVSVGVAATDRDGVDKDGVLALAGAAMSRAKEAGRDCYAVMEETAAADPVHPSAG